MKKQHVYIPGIALVTLILVAAVPPRNRSQR